MVVMDDLRQGDDGGRQPVGIQGYRAKGDTPGDAAMRTTRSCAAFGHFKNFATYWA
jgi:hypothetical protein